MLAIVSTIDLDCWLQKMSMFFRNCFLVGGRIGLPTEFCTVKSAYSFRVAYENTFRDVYNINLNQRLSASLSKAASLRRFSYAIVHYTLMFNCHIFRLRLGWLDSIKSIFTSKASASTWVSHEEPITNCQTWITQAK